MKSRCRYGGCFNWPKGEGSFAPALSRKSWQTPEDPISRRIFQGPIRPLINVPKGHLTIAQRFNVGWVAKRELVPKARLSGLPYFSRPFGTGRNRIFADTGTQQQPPRYLPWPGGCFFWVRPRPTLVWIPPLSGATVTPIRVNASPWESHRLKPGLRTKMCTTR